MTLGDLREAVLRRLGDIQRQVWTQDEVDLHLVTGYRLLAAVTRVFWDQAYAENLPAGFSCTQPWETAFETFTYGVSSYTFDDERAVVGWHDEPGPANHTCPAETALLSSVEASTAIPATSALPITVTTLDRATWDGMTLDATTPQRAERMDPRYQQTTGEVYAYTYRQDGLHTLRKIRVPATMAATYVVSGSWGLLRDPTDITTETVAGTWGIGRRLPWTFAMGWDAPWGAPRRVYRSGTNVCVEHWREGRPMASTGDGCELPDLYARYLRDYAQARCLGRSGPGQNPQLSAHYDQRWGRSLARLSRRLIRLNHAHVGVLGGAVTTTGGPPRRPQLPWNYGRVVRP